ncbi:MAG: hypothetical protein V2I57_04660 [Xanthomonadales bacterium]|jgi:hypothetical protein|nr:hypothetical protein [Xanthomonadales bacterium]
MPAMISQGVSEFVFGAEWGEEDDLLRFWEALGFTPVAEGTLPANAAEALYGHDRALRSVRLVHSGCSSFNTGYVRLQLWDRCRNDGLGEALPLEPGSRWMGMYCQDILQVRDAFTAPSSIEGWGLWVSPLVNAPLAHPPPEPTFWAPFVGLRETLVFGRSFRLAFIQRGGFDRPGFGTFDPSLAFRNTEGSHASLVQPPNAFDTAFYKTVFGFETAPYGEAHVSGDEPPTKIALRLEPEETFHVERLRAPEVPSGLLQVYSPHVERPDRRDVSRAGSRNLCLYSVQTDRLGELRDAVTAAGGTRISDIRDDEFGHPALTFDARDGLQWLATAHVG